MRFHLGDILSITTGRLVSLDHMAGVHRILNHLTGCDLTTMELPAASAAMRPYLAAQFPQLARVAVPRSFRDEAHVLVWLAEQASIYGEWHKVTPA